MVKLQRESLLIKITLQLHEENWHCLRSKTVPTSQSPPMMFKSWIVILFFYTKSTLVPSDYVTLHKSTLIVMPYLVIKLCQIIKSINKGLCFNRLLCLISSFRDWARVLGIGFWSESNGKNYLLHLIINYIVWLHFVCWLKENITFIILERYLTPVIERVWSDTVILFLIPCIKIKI